MNIINMVNIKFYTKKNCEACRIAKKIISNIINDLEFELSLRIIPNTEDHIDDIVNDSIEMFPTTIIYYNNKEISRLTGTYTKNKLMEAMGKKDNILIN